MRNWILLGLLVTSHFAGYSPFGALFTLAGQAWGSLRSNVGPITPEDSLTAAIRNVTSDYDQVCSNGKLLRNNKPDMRSGLVRELQEVCILMLSLVVNQRRIGIRGLATCKGIRPLSRLGRCPLVCCAVCS